MSDLPKRLLGRTGLEVTALGYGAMELRGQRGGVGRDVDDGAADRILNAVLDAGINFIDTSPDYGVAEEQIGKHIASRREEYYLASKCGCPVDRLGEVRPRHDYSPGNVRAGVEQSLRRMRTDYLDLVQIHISPPRQELEQCRTVEAMQRLQEEGKVRFIGISATLPHLPDHLAMGCFDAFQIPYSAVEREHESLISEVASAGSGTIIRGGVGKGIPAASNPDYSNLADRFRTTFEQRRRVWDEAALADVLDGMDTMEFMLRFTLSHPDLHTTIVGTSRPAHLAANVAAACKGPLPAEQYAAARQRLPA